MNHSFNKKVQHNHVHHW